MAEYINRASLINHLNTFAPEHYNSLVNDLILKEPAADVVEVVRCKDCIHYDGRLCHNPNTFDDEKTAGNTTDMWYCADGEKKNG